MCGDTYQLGLESDEFDVVANLSDLSDAIEVDPFRLNPVYLKDLLQ